MGPISDRFLFMTEQHPGRGAPTRGPSFTPDSTGRDASRDRPPASESSSSFSASRSAG